MAVVNSNGDGPVAEDNGGTMGLAKDVEDESSSNQKDAIVDKDSTDGKVETNNSIDQPEDKEETSKEQNTSTHDVQSASQHKKVSFAMSAERESVEEFKTGNDFTSENVEEKAVATSPDGRFLKFDVEIGRGSFKTVYKALDTETGVAVAWCELLPNFPQDKKGKAEQFRFKEEAKMLKTLQHPNILRFYDSWEAPCKGSARVDGRPERKMLILITELMTSGTLKGYLRRFKDVKPKIIRSWGRQILKGLNYLHSRTPPIIHRDLKCDNIFINGTTGMVKIGDLGLATLKRSHVKTVIGTPEFMAPEMYDEHYDESVDVYAFGMCLLEMTTLQYPYMECTNPAQIYKRVTQGKKPNAMEKVKDPTIREIIVGCIREAKENRFTVKTLLAHPFFLAELEGIEIKAATSNTSDDEVQLTFQVARKVTKVQNPPHHDTYERPFNLHSDQAQSIAQEMAKLNVIRDTEVEAMTKLIQTKVDEAKRPRTASEVNPPSSIQHSVSVVDQDMTSANHEKYDHPVTPAIDDDRSIPDSTQAITVDPTTTDNTSNKSSPHATTDKVQQLLDGAGSSSNSTKVAENGDKKNLPSPEATVSSSISLLPNSSTTLTNSPSHKMKEQVQHSRESSSDMSQTSDSQPSMPKEPAADPSITASTNGEPKKQKSRDHDRDTDEQQPESLSQDSITQETAKGDIPAKPPAQQQKKNRPKGVSKSTKERRPLKLTIAKIVDDLVACTLSNGGQTISFKFRLDADSSEEIAQGMVSANHLNENQKEEFKEYAEQMIKMARQNEIGGTVGGSSTNLQLADHKNVTMLQRDGDERTPNNVAVEPSLLEKSENGGHKQLEKTESTSKVSPTTAVGGENTQPLETTSRVNIGSQTSMEAQPDKSPPPSPVSVVKIAVDPEQCSIQQELCPTSEYSPFTLPTTTTTTTTTAADVQSSESTSTTTTVSSQPLTLPLITATPLGVPPVTNPAPLVTTPVTDSAPPVTNPVPPVTIAVVTTPGIVTQSTRKFIVEPVCEDSGDEESIANEETITNVPSKIYDTPSGQDERRDSGDTDTMPAGGDMVQLHVSDDKMMAADDKVIMTDDKITKTDDKTTNTESQRPFQHHTPHTTSPYPEGFRGGPPIVEHLSSLSESFSVLMYSVLQVLRNPAMESFVKDLDNKYGNGSGPVVQECSQDVEYQNLTMKFEEEQRELKEQQRRRLDDFLQRRKRSATASPVGMHRPVAINSNRAKQQQHAYHHPDLSSYTFHPQQQHNVAWPTPEGENMERKVKEALMTELTTKNKPSGKSDSSKSFQRVAPPPEGGSNNQRTLSKSSTILPQLPSHNVPLQQVYRAPSVSNWPGDNFHSGSTPNLEVNHEPPSSHKPDVSEFDPYETKNK